MFVPRVFFLLLNSCHFPSRCKDSTGPSKNNGQDVDINGHGLLFGGNWTEFTFGINLCKTNAVQNSRLAFMLAFHCVVTVATLSMLFVEPPGIDKETVYWDTFPEKWFPKSFAIPSPIHVSNTPQKSMAMFNVIGGMQWISDSNHSATRHLPAARNRLRLRLRLRLCLCLRLCLQWRWSSCCYENLICLKNMCFW